MAGQLSINEIKERISTGEILHEASKKSMAEFHRLRNAFKLSTYEGYKRRLVWTTFGPYINFFDPALFYATPWSILVKLSSPDFDLTMRHKILHLMHYGIKRSQHDQEPSVYSIDMNFEVVSALIVKSIEETVKRQIDQLYASMLVEEGLELTSKQKEALQRKERIIIVTKVQDLKQQPMQEEDEEMREDAIPEQRLTEMFEYVTVDTGFGFSEKEISNAMHPEKAGDSSSLAEALNNLIKEYQKDEVVALKEKVSKLEAALEAALNALERNETFLIAAAQLVTEDVKSDGTSTAQAIRNFLQ